MLFRSATSVLCIVFVDSDDLIVIIKIVTFSFFQLLGVQQYRYVQPIELFVSVKTIRFALPGNKSFVFHRQLLDASKQHICTAHTVTGYAAEVFPEMLLNVFRAVAAAIK